jgi:dimethylglycine dehydrogenase
VGTSQLQSPFLDVKNAEPGDAVEMMVLVHPHRATTLHELPFDPNGERLGA